MRDFVKAAALAASLVIAGAVLLSVFFPHPFPWWPWWGWLALCLIAEGLIIYTSVTDLDTAATVVAGIFREDEQVLEAQQRAQRLTFRA